jgi:chromosome segregation ATPase
VDTPAVPALLIGTLFVEKGLITQEQLDLALEEQGNTGERLGEILVERFGVSRLDLASALAEQWAEYERQGTIDPGSIGAESIGTGSISQAPVEVGDLAAVSGEWKDADATTIDKRPIGEIFVERGMIDEDDLAKALDEQRATGRRLGEILVAQGNLTRLELASALADQWASFQKLRPPTADNGVRPPVETSPVMPTPEVARPAATVSAAELTSLQDQIDSLTVKIDGVERALTERPDTDTASPDSLRAELDAVVARVENLATQLIEGRQAPIDLPEDLTSRLTDLEQRLDGLAANRDDAGDGLRASLAAVEEKLRALESGSGPWQQALDSLAAELADRIATVEEARSSEPSPEPALDEALHAEVRLLAARLDEVGAQQPSGIDEIRDALAALSARVDEVPTPNEEWREQIEGLAVRLDGLASQTSALDQVRASVAELGARIDSIPAPSEEWREQLESLSARIGSVDDDVRRRLDQVERDSGKRSGRGDTKQLGRRIDELSTSLPQTKREIDAALATLSARVAAISASSAEWREQLDALATKQPDGADRIPDELRAVRERLDSLSARIDQIPAPNEEWRPQLEALRGRLDAVLGAQAPALEEVRNEVTSLSERVDAIPPPNDEWRGELGEVAENLRVRMERVEAEASERASNSELAEVKQRVDEVADRLPGERQELETAIAALSARLDGIPTSTEEWRDYVDALRARLDDLATTQPSAVEELRVELATLGARIDAIPEPSDEWRDDLAALEARIETVPDDVRVRLDRIEEWRPELAQIAENLRGRIERVEAGLELRPGLDLVAGLREELQTLTAQLESRLDEAERRHSGCDERLDRLAGLPSEIESLEPRLRDELARQLDGRLAARDEHEEELRREIDEASRRIGHVEPALDRLAELERRLDEHSERLAGLQSSGPSAAEVAETVNARLDASDAAAVDLATTLDEHVAALERRVTAVTSRADSEVESLRRELDDVRGVSAAGSAAAEAKIDQLADTLRSEIASVAPDARQDEALERLGALAADHGESLEALQAELHQREQRFDERLVGKAAELAALRARLDQGDSSLAALGDGARDATEQVDARFATLDEKIEALEKSQVKRGDVRELRESVARVEQKVDAEAATEDARVRAVEEALRDGLASLGSRLSETRSTYVEAGDALRRSIDRLGSAIRSADDELAPPQPDSPRAIDLSSFLAFAPTPEGYRLIELPGPPPAIGEAVEVPEFPPQVVARLGVSPLPFDRRACAYLEPS